MVIFNQQRKASRLRGRPSLAMVFDFPLIEEHGVTSLEIKQWNENESGQLSLKKIREIFQPSDRYRISQSDYPAGAEFDQSIREGICYVLSGAVTFYLCQQEVELHSMQFVALPEGTHTVQVGSDAPVSMVFVWELPARVRPH